MEAIAYFNTDYFSLELQRAGVIKNDFRNDSQSLTLKKVPNITIGLVIAAISLKRFENRIILNWIRKGRKVTALIEEQFALYDKLFVYLKGNVCKEEIIQEWKQLLDGAKYVFPQKEHKGWSQIFGYTPNLLENVDPNNTALTESENDEDLYDKTKVEMAINVNKDDENKYETINEINPATHTGSEKNEIIYDKTNVEITVNEIKEYEEKNETIDDIKTTAFTGTENYKIINDKPNVEIVINEIKEDEDNNEKNNEIKQVALTGSGKDSNINDKTNVEIAVNEIKEDEHNNEKTNEIKSVALTGSENYKSMIDKTNVEITLNEINKDENRIEKNCEMKSATFTGSVIDENIYNKTNVEMTVNEIKEDEDNNEKINDVKPAALTGSEKDRNINNKNNVEMADNEINEDEDKNEASSKIKQAIFTESDSDQNKYIDKSILSNNKNTLSGDYSSDQIKSTDNSNTVFSSLSEKKISSSELCKDKLTQSEGDDLSDWDEELENLFNAVGAELTAAENDEKSLLESSNKKNEVNQEYLSESVIQSERNKTNENNSNLDMTAEVDIEAEENIVGHNSIKLHGGFTMEYFLSVLKKAGMFFFKKVTIDKKLTKISPANISVGFLCSIKALDLFTNEEIFLWIKKCCTIKRTMRLHDHIKLASYRELANYLMNEADIKDEKRWKWFLNDTTHLDYTYQTERDLIKYLQNHQWKIVFGYERKIPEICHSIKIKFNRNYYFAQLLGYDAIKREVKDGTMQSYLIKMIQKEQLTVGLVLAAKAVDIFSDDEIVSWICRCKKLTTIDSGMIYEQLAIFKEFSNYLENEADERDYDHVNSLLFKEHYNPMRNISEMPSGWKKYFNRNINLHKRFKDFKCCHDDQVGSLEVVEPVCLEPYEVCKVWNDLFEEKNNQDSDIPSKNLFHSNYFRNLLISKNITEELNKVLIVTVGLVMATIHEKFPRQKIFDWVEECHGTRPTKRQFFMYKILCDHLLGLKCNIEASYWKQLLNSVKYQVPVENFDIWSNIFGNQIPNLVGLTFVGNLEFEKDYRIIRYRKYEYESEALICIKSAQNLQSPNSGSMDEKQNLIFDKEYFASLLTSCGALSDSNRILKSVPNVTIGQVMAAIVDITLNEEDIYDWIKQSEKYPCTRKTLETLDLKPQFFAYKLLASHLINYESENQNDSYLISWKKILSTRYAFSHVGQYFSLEQFISPQINSIYLSHEYFVSKKYELKFIVHEVKKGYQTQHLEDIEDIILSNKKSIPIFNIVNRKKISGIGKSFFLKLLKKTGVLDKAVQFKSLNNSTLKKVIHLRVGHVVAVLALGVFQETVIRRWIALSKGKMLNTIMPFGPLKRITHYLLCEVPSELAMEWVELLTKTPLKIGKKSPGLGNIHALFDKCAVSPLSNNITQFKRQKRSNKCGASPLCNHIIQFKHKADYMPNECKAFIKGECTKYCGKLHICSKLKFCISLSKSCDKDKEATEDESESLVTTKTENDFLMLLKNKKTERIPKKTERIRKKTEGISEKKKEYPIFKKKEIIPGMCNRFNFQGKCPAQACRHSHCCNICSGDHPRIRCTNKVPKKTKKIPKETKRQGSLKRKPGMCYTFNSQGACPNKACKWPHCCDGCCGDHPRIKCIKEFQSRDGHLKFGNDSVDEERKNKRSRFENEDFNSGHEVSSNSRTWQHQLPSLLPPLSYPHGSQSAYPHGSQSAYPHGSQSAYPHGSQSFHHSRMLNSAHSEKNTSLPLSMNESMSGVVEKVAKLTHNKDTSCIVEHIKREVNVYGIPATMDNIGKLVMEVSEIHKTEVMRGDLSGNYGHGSSSNSTNEPAVSFGYDQPNWNQSSGRHSQERVGDMDHTGGNNQWDNTWFQSSGSIETYNSGMLYQQSSGNMQGWSQGHGPSGVQILPQGHTSVMAQGWKSRKEMHKEQIKKSRKEKKYYRNPAQNPGPSKKKGRGRKKNSKGWINILPY